VTARLAWLALIVACSTPPAVEKPTALEGRNIFRFDTFGDEAFWTDTLRMHEVIQGVSPAKALAVGLKVDLDALPASLVSDLKAGRVDLASPATTVALLKLNAVVGVQAEVDTTGHISRFGVTCALCHSTVALTRAPGRGHPRCTHVVGRRQVRCALEPRREERSGGDPSGVWARGDQPRDVYR